MNVNIAYPRPARRGRVIALHCSGAGASQWCYFAEALGGNIPEAATFADALDAGLFLVDETGHIVHANASGHAMLRERSVLREAAGRLVACEVHAATALKKLLASVSGGDAVSGAKPIAVPLSTRDGKHYVAHILPLTSGARRSAGAACPAVAAIFVYKAALEVPSPAEVIAKFYNLTPSELRVLLAIVDVGGVPETARALGVAEATVKTPPPCVRQDRRHTSARSRQAGRRVFQSTRWGIKAFPDPWPQSINRWTRHWPHCGYGLNVDTHLSAS